MTYQIEPLNAWPDAELLVVAWLRQRLGNDVNVVTETDTTFGTSNPKPTMSVPLVRVTRVPGGSHDPTTTTEEAVIDVEYFGKNRDGAWGLYRYGHAAMLQLAGQRTPQGAVDDVTVDNGAGDVDYANPNLRRVVATYALALRAQATV